MAKNTQKKMKNVVDANIDGNEQAQVDSIREMLGLPKRPVQPSFDDQYLSDEDLIK